MGKGDIKTKKGKQARGSYGNSRPHSKKQTVSSVAPKPKKKPAAKRKK